MSKDKPIRENKMVWRIRDKNGYWKDLPEGAELEIKIPGYGWSPCVVEKTGLRILNFNLN